MDLAGRIAKLSPGQRKILEQKLRQQNIDVLPIQVPQVGISKKHTLWTLNHVEKKEYYPLSTSQKRLYILNLFVDYSIQLGFRVDGNLDKERLREVFKKLIRRHESLRTSFEEWGGEPVQRVHDQVEFEIEYYELNDMNEKEIITSFIQPFDLSKAPLLKVALIKLDTHRNLLIIYMHHLVLDGVSMRILSGEFIRLYLGEKLPETRARYLDFAEWQNRLQGREEYKKQEAYWLEVLGGETPVLNMPTDHPRPAMQSFAGKKIRFEIKEQMLAALKNLTLNRAATVYMVLLAVYNTLLLRYSAQEDIIIGTISAGRQQREVQHMVGVFINPLALRNFPSNHKTFAGFLKEVKQNTLKAFENQLYPFGDLLDKVVKKKDFSMNPLFNAMIVFQNVDIGNPGLEGLRFELYEPENGADSHAQQDLCLWVEEGERRIIIDLEYCAALFKRETMERFIRHFLALLTGAAKQPASTLGEIAMISEQEKQQVLTYFNNTDTLFPEVHLIHRLFEEQAERTPDRIAVVKEKTVHQALELHEISYRELNEISNRLAQLLIEKGVKGDTIVGIMLERSIEMIASVIGILKAGGAYLPIDPDYPLERIEYILKDSEVRILINKSEIRNPKLETNSNVQKINAQNKNFEDLLVLDFEHLNFDIVSNFDIRASDLNPSNLAYIIYTSGTTGKPKGVMVEHRSFVNAAFAWKKDYKLAEMEVILLQMANFSFDVFAGDFARTFIAGGKMVICPDEVKVDPPALYELCRAQWVTLFEATPSLVIPFMEYVYEKGLNIDHLRLLIVGSDSVRAEDFKKLVSRFAPRMRIINSYGVTEATIDSSYFEESIEKLPSSGYVPIGKPMSNMKFFILDSNGSMQPVGFTGELNIGGKGVVRGYLNNPELTAEKFNRSYRTNRTYILYKTGDLARWLSDGNVEFLGRRDYQVKIRGFRIELEEIENRLTQHNDIKEAVVLAKEDKSGAKSLCAYIVPTERAKNPRLTVSELRNHLLSQLPDYMVPSHFIEIMEIPLTTNGKIDKNSLLTFEGGIDTGIEYVPPSNEIERKLADLWSEILMRDRIGIHDNFFDLGGQSLKAMRLTGRIKEVFDVKIPLVTFFQAGTIKGIAETISREQLSGRHLPSRGKFEKKERRLREV